MNENIEVIRCDFDDPLHCKALVDLMNEYIADKMGDGIPYSEDQKEMLIKGLRAHTSKLILFAKAGNRFIGLANCFINFATFTVKPFVNIHDVIVTNDWRNKGIGRIMLSRVIQEAEMMGCSKVTLEVRDDNMNAQHLYTSLGFHDAEPRQYYWAKYL